MASKESSRYGSLNDVLKQLRGKPPTVLEQTFNFSTYCQNVAKEESAKQLLEQLLKIDVNKQQLVAILDHVVHLKKIVLRVGAIRVNKWGKTEFLLTELVTALKSLKATPSEIEALAWITYNTSDDEQKKFIDEKISSGAPTNFALRLLEIRVGKNNGMFPGNKDPVFGSWQIVKLAGDSAATPPVDPATSYPVDSSSSSSSSAPPPAKKRKTTPKEKKDKTPEKPSEPTVESEPVAGEENDIVQ